MNLKEHKKGYMGAFKQRKEKRKLCNYIIMSKKKKIILKTHIASRVQIGNTVQVNFVSFCL